MLKPIVHRCTCCGQTFEGDFTNCPVCQDGRADIPLIGDEVVMVGSNAHAVIRDIQGVFHTLGFMDGNAGGLYTTYNFRLYKKGPNHIS